jgi:hypothetical protein
VFLLSGDDNIDLASSWSERSYVAFDTKQHQLRHVAEVKSNPATVRASIFADLVPNNIGLIGESPCLHNAKSLSNERIRAPKVEVALVSGKPPDRQCRDLIE